MSLKFITSLFLGKYQSGGGGGGSTPTEIALLSVTTAPSGSFAVGSKYYNSSTKKIVTAITADTWTGATESVPSLQVYYTFGGEYYIWAGNSLKETEILGEIKKFAGKITTAGFAAMWVTTQAAITKASCLLYTKIKALYDALPLFLGDYTSATKTASKIAYEDGYFYFYENASNILKKSAKADLSDADTVVTILPYTYIHTFILGKNVNVICTSGTGPTQYHIYTKSWDLLQTIEAPIASDAATKTKQIGNKLYFFTGSNLFAINDIVTENYTMETLYSSGGNNQIQDFDYFNGEYYWSVLVYPGGYWYHRLLVGNPGEQTQLFEVGNDYSHSGLTVNASGIVWNYGANGTIKFSSDGEIWEEKSIADTPDLDFDASEPNNFFAVAKDADDNFIAYSKAYIVNLTDTPTTPSEWTFVKTGLAQVESAPKNDIVFTEKGNAYFCDDKYIYVSKEKQLKTKDFTIGEDTITISYYELSDGSAVCMPTQQTNLDLIFADSGKVDFFVLDTENETVRPIRDNTNGYQYLNVGGSYIEATTEKLAI